MRGNERHALSVELGSSQFAFHEPPEFRHAQFVNVKRVALSPAGDCGIRRRANQQPARPQYAPAFLKKSGLIRQVLDRLEGNHHVHAFVRQVQTYGLGLQEQAFLVRCPRVIDDFPVNVHADAVLRARFPQILCADARAAGHIENVFPLHVFTCEHVAFFVFAKQCFFGFSRNNAFPGEFQIRNFLRYPGEPVRCKPACAHLFSLNRLLRFSTPCPERFATARAPPKPKSGLLRPAPTSKLRAQIRRATRRRRTRPPECRRCREAKISFRRCLLPWRIRRLRQSTFFGLRCARRKETAGDAPAKAAAKPRSLRGWTTPPPLPKFHTAQPATTPAVHTAAVRTGRVLPPCPASPALAGSSTAHA